MAQNKENENIDQKFTRLEDGKIKWEYYKSQDNFEDEEFGVIGTKGGYDYIIFDSKEQAMSVLDRDIQKLEEFKEQYAEEMSKNSHELEKFSELKDVIDGIAKLNSQFQSVTGENVQKLYENDPKKYQKLLREFNSAKDYIKNEVAELSKEFQKYQNYNTAKQSYDFTSEELEKIYEQKEQLKEV